MDQSNHNFLHADSQAGVTDRMRELLARAAQDHVYEQRTQGAALDEIRQRLEGMEWLLREVRERELGGLTGQIDSVHNRVADLAERAPGWAELLAEQLEQLGERVKPTAELPSLWADVGVVSESVDEALGKLQTILDATQRAAQQVEELAGRLEKLQGTMAAAALRFNRLDKSLADLNERAGRLEEAIGRVGEQIGQGLNDMTTRVEQQYGALGGTIQQGLDAVGGRIEAAGSRIEGKVDGLTGHIDGVGGRIEGLDGRLEGLDGRLEGLDGRLEGVQGRLDGVDGRLNGMEGHFEGLGGRLDGVEGRFDGVDGRFDRLDGQFEGLGGRFDKVDGLFEKVDGLFEKVEGHFDGVGGRFEALDGHFEGLGGRLEALDDRLEAVNQRLGQLPATLDIGELHRRLREILERPAVDPTERLDALDRRLSETVGPIAAEVRARPDREEVEETMSKIVEAAHDDVARRLGILEETMLALAEALLRPAQRREGKPEA